MLARVFNVLGPFWICPVAIAACMGPRALLSYCYSQELTATTTTRTQEGSKSKSVVQASEASNMVDREDVVVKERTFSGTIWDSTQSQQEAVMGDAMGDADSTAM